MCLYLQLLGTWKVSKENKTNRAMVTTNAMAQRTVKGGNKMGRHHHSLVLDIFLASSPMTFKHYLQVPFH